VQAAYEPPRDAIKRLGMNLEELDKSKVTFFRGRGCDVCKGSGYKGRVGCYELMPVTDKVRELILAHASAYAFAKRDRGRNEVTERGCDGEDSPRRYHARRKPARHLRRVAVVVVCQGR
jgi:type II secretory ATPase GspE/PulE/Tfp pilus assembly ATPase PilB-like protein